MSDFRQPGHRVSARLSVVYQNNSHTVMDSPCGPLTLVATNGVLSGLYMDYQRYRPADELFGVPDPQPFSEAIRQLGEYFAGERTDFDLPVHFNGTPFQCTVWTALCDIPYGETVSYRELADRLGRPTASRAVGLANGRNPISIIVPCHRVVGSNGDLTGYGGGIERKRYLLDFESGGTLAYSWRAAEPNATLNRSHQITTLRRPVNEVPAGMA